MLNFLAVLIDGLSYGALLYLLAIGLSITLGLMGFVNLAHTALAMIGGYLAVTFVSSWQWPFVWAVLGAVVITTVVGVILEQSVFRLVYRRSPLAQVLLTIGFMMIIGASVTYLWGSALQLITIPEALEGRTQWGPLSISRYRLLLLAISVTLLIVLSLGLDRTRFGTMVRAAVDNQRVAAALGIPINKVFMACFAIGTALAGLGGALGVQALGLDPAFAVKYLVLALLVVVVGGAGSVTGTFMASMALGVLDIATKYYLPDLGSFAMYAIMVVLLLVRPQGLRGLRKGDL